MSYAAHRPRFTLTVTGLATELRVLTFRGSEALSQPFVFDLEVVSTQPYLELETLLFRPAALQVQGEGEAERWIHGVLSAVGRGACGRLFTHYHLRLSPHLHRLGQRHNLRVFHRQQVPDIVCQVLREAGLSRQDYRLELHQSYPVRARCTQYNESDLDFIERLLREEGIHYRFEHSPDGHVLVLSDREQDFPALQPRTIPFRADAVMVEQPIIQAFQPSWALTPDQVTLSDYNPFQPQHGLKAQAGTTNNSRTGLHAWPGGHEQLADGERRARNWLLAEQAAGRTIQGQGTAHWLQPGRMLRLDQHPIPALNQDYLLLAVEHQGYQPQVLEEENGGGACHYHNQFQALPATLPHRPSPVQTRPRALPQTAWVSGLPDGPIHSDRHGRIRVRFHWQRDPRDYGWLRVTQTWAGNGWGSLILPRVGQEVLVVFLDDNPDRPLVSGTLYHRLQRPPQALPHHRAQGLLRSRNLVDKRGHEILLEDQTGQERIRLHTTGDLLLQTRRHRRTRIEGDTHEIIRANRITRVGGHEHRSLNRERRIQIQGHDFQELDQALHLNAGGVIRISGGHHLHLKSGLQALLDAGLEVVLQVGASHIRLHPAGLVLNAPTIHVAESAIAAPASDAEKQRPRAALRIDRLERTPRG